MLITLNAQRIIHLAAAGGLWWVLSGHGDWLMLSLGFGSAAFSVLLAMRMQRYDREIHPFVINRELVRYWSWLALAVVKANLEVMRHILALPLRISPTWVRVHTGPKTEVGMATLANSITMTPGTVAVDVEEGAITVHALTREAAEYLQSGDLEHRARDPGRAPRGRW